MTTKRKRNTEMTKACREAAAAERAELLKRLDEFLAEHEDSEDGVTLARIGLWSERYSGNNAALIVMQRPEATEIRGYRDWQAHGRQVRKGEHGIRIIAPAGQAEGIEAQPATETTPAVEGQEGRKFFRLISVFDISQTDEIEKQEAVAA